MGRICVVTFKCPLVTDLRISLLQMYLVNFRKYSYEERLTHAFFESQISDR